MSTSDAPTRFIRTHEFWLAIYTSRFPIAIAPRHFEATETSRAAGVAFHGYISFTYSPF